MPEEKSSISPDDQTYYHNLGQEDAARGEWNSQMPPLGGLFARDIDFDRQIAYDKGHDNPKQQTEK